MKAAWSNSRGEHPKICDYAYAQRGEAILIDANNRNLPKKFADRSAAGSDLHAEIQNMFAATKFGQLTSTARQFLAQGWTTVTRRSRPSSKFLPFVVAPNAGIPSNEFTEMLILEQAMPLIAVFNSKVLPPTIMTWRDLQILEGIAEQAKGGRIIELLIMWRISNYLKLTRGAGFPYPWPTSSTTISRSEGRCRSTKERWVQHFSRICASTLSVGSSKLIRRAPVSSSD